MSADLYDEDLNESIVDGFKRIDLIRTYKVITDSRTDSAFAARNQAGVPKLGAVVSTTTGEILQVTNVHPRRAAVDQTGRLWMVAVTMSNGTNDFPRDINGRPVSNVTQAVKDVDIQWLEEQEDVTGAKLLSITKKKPWDDAGPGDVLTVPNWLQAQQSGTGPVTNSAGVVQDVQRSTFRKLITVSKWVGTWTDYSDYLGKINTDEITITQGDAQGTKLTEVCPARSLLLHDVIKEDVWQDGILYFRQRFVLSKHPRRWIHSQIDQGTKRILIVDEQYKPDNSGDKIDQAYLDAANIESTWGYEEITTTDQNGNVVALGEPVRFNGWGSNSPNERAATYDGNEPVFMNYQVYGERSFAGLNL